MNYINNNLYSYFTSRDIKIVNYSFENRDPINLGSVKRQISNIIDFQNAAKGYRDNILPRICGSIGKDLESFKVQVRNLHLDLDGISEKSNKNSIDIFILEQGEDLLSRGKRAINHMESSGYIKLIKRSMVDYEVCLGRVHEGNLRKGEDGKIEVGTIKYLTYNLMEHDIYSYLRHIKKKDNKLNIEDIMEYLLEEEILGENSIEYLRGLLSYPVESLKLWDKYRKSKKKLTEEEYVDVFFKASKNDGVELIAKGGEL